MDEILKQTLLPLLGGFCFIAINWRVRFIAVRASGEKLFLMCAVAGVVLAVVGRGGLFLMVLLLLHFFSAKHVLQLQALWRQALFFPPSHLCAFALGPLLAWALNKRPRWSRDAALAWAVERVGDRLEELLERSRQDRRFLLITLRCGRVYMGIVRSNVPALMGQEHVTLIPFMSGFRRPPSSQEYPGRIEFTTFYEDLVTQLRMRADRPRTPETPLIVPIQHGDRVLEIDALDMGILFSKAEIETVTLFTFEAYALLNKDRFPDLWESVVAAQGRPIVPPAAVAGEAEEESIVEPQSQPPRDAELAAPVTPESSLPVDASPAVASSTDATVADPTMNSSVETEAHVPAAVTSTTLATTTEPHPVEEPLTKPPVEPAAVESAVETDAGHAPAEPEGATTRSNENPPKRPEETDH